MPRNDRLPSGSPVDVLVVVGSKEEFDALIQVRSHRPGEWTENSDHDPPYCVGVLEGTHGPVRIAVARATATAMTSVAIVVERLMALEPRSLAMCGVCHGHPDSTDLGDVIIADRVFQHDQGALTVGGFEADLWVHSPGDTWLRAAQDLEGRAAALAGYREASGELAKWWLLQRLLAGRDAYGSIAFSRYFPDDRRAEALAAMIKAELVHLAGRELTLTDRGREEVERYRVLHGVEVTQCPYYVHVGPIGSGNYESEDGRLWEQFPRSGQRKALGVETDAVVIGQIAHGRSLPFVVVKGVAGHADGRDDSRFRAFAARASGEVLLSFLARVTVPVATSSTDHGARFPGGHRWNSNVSHTLGKWKKVDCVRQFLAQELSHRLAGQVDRLRSALKERCSPQWLSESREPGREQDGKLVRDLIEDWFVEHDLTELLGILHDHSLAGEFVRAARVSFEWAKATNDNSGPLCCVAARA